MYAPPSPQQYLLLLPPILELYPKYATIYQVYYSPLQQLLIHLKTVAPSQKTTLDIALLCPHLCKTTGESSRRAALYPVTQNLVASVYKLIGIIAARHDIEVADVEGETIDVRVILTAYPHPSENDQDNTLAEDDASSPLLYCSDVVVQHMSLLARCRRKWQTIFSTPKTTGQAALLSFQKFAPQNFYKYETLNAGKSDDQITGLPASCHHHKSEGDSTANKDSNNSNPCRSVAVGGTFDHLHIGHKLLLTMTMFALDAVSLQEEDQSIQNPKTRIVTIGITAESLLEKKQYAELLQSWDTRAATTHTFIKGITDFSPTSSVGDADGGKATLTETRNPGANGHVLTYRTRGLEVRYTEIWDPFGPTITDPDIDSLVVSGESRNGGQMVNDKRKELRMTSLAVFEVVVLNGNDGNDDDVAKDDFQSKISSSAIRKIQKEKLHTTSTR